MASPRLIRYESIESLRNAADAWDDLWHRSDATLPTGRAELIAQYIEQFAPHDRFLALAVEQDGQLIAALPLLDRRVAKIIHAGSFPSNNWAWAGDLLLDPTADVAQSLALLLAELRRGPWPLLWFNAVPLQSSRWQAMTAALSAAGLGSAAHPRFVIGAVEIVDALHRDWDAYNRMLSGNLRRQLGKAQRRASIDGLDLDLCMPRLPAEVESLIREGFEIENRSWKGQARSSVTANPEMEHFYLRQATQLARWGQLQLAFLRHKDRAIAFEYGWFSKGIYFSPKVGYDDAFARFSPGQTLRHKLLEYCFESPDCHAVDFCGPLAEATAKWSTRTYPISRLVIDNGTRRGKALLRAYKFLRPRRKHVAGQEFQTVDLARLQEQPLSATAD